MSLIKLNNNAVKNITSVGSIGTGDLVFISKQTASSSASISFTSGIDSTYKEYIFFINNVHPQNDNVDFNFQASTNSGSSYGVTATNTYFRSIHNEADTDTQLAYDGGEDVAQSTSFFPITMNIGNENEQSGSGFLHLFNPSSTTFVKHFISRTSSENQSDFACDIFVGGYFNTTSSIDAVRFQFDSGNIDSGDILLYGVN